VHERLLDFGHYILLEEKMVEITYFAVTPKGQKGNNLQFYRIAVRGSRRPLTTLKAYIKEQRKNGDRFQGQVYIHKIKQDEDFVPQFESDNAKIFEFPIENATGRLEE
jgi:hypothetical protein